MNISMYYNPNNADISLGAAAPVSVASLYSGVSPEGFVAEPTPNGSIIVGPTITNLSGTGIVPLGSLTVADGAGIASAIAAALTALPAAIARAL